MAIEKVDVDEKKISVIHSDGKVETIRWDQLQEIKAVTGDNNPFDQQAAFMLIGKEGACCTVPTEISVELVEKFKALPGFDEEKLKEAMSCPVSDQFVCWTRI